jgi:hypothetical protein
MVYLEGDEEFADVPHGDQPKSGECAPRQREPHTPSALGRVLDDRPEKIETHAQKPHELCRGKED